MREHMRLMQGQKRLEFAREMLEKKCGKPSTGTSLR